MSISPILPNNLSGLNQSVDEAGGAATIAQTPAMPANNPPVAAVKKPSLMMRILSGALLGMGAGMAAERPEQAFGAGMGAVESARDKQMQRQLLLGREQREQQQLALEAEKVGFERQRLGLETRKADELTALTNLNKLRLSKEIDQMDSEQKRKWEETTANLIQSYSQAGLRIKHITEDDHASMTAAAQELGPPQDTKTWMPGKDTQSAPVETTVQRSPLFDLMPLHDRANNRILYFERPDDMKKFPDDPKKFPDIILPSGRRIPVAGQPIALTDARFHLEATIEAARINVAGENERYRLARQAAEKPLTMKEALQQARQELAPLVEADSYLPESRRQFKDESAVAKAVDKRSRELLDLDSQLRRSGLTQTGNVLGVLGALKLQRQRGASDIQLKQQIAQVANTGQLTGAEIVALYNQLGLVPAMQSISVSGEGSLTRTPQPIVTKTTGGAEVVGQK
jgi:hypothetical protein